MRGVVACKSGRCLVVQIASNFFLSLKRGSQWNLDVNSEALGQLEPCGFVLKKECVVVGTGRRGCTGRVELSGWVLAP